MYWKAGAGWRRRTRLFQNQQLRRRSIYRHPC
ncbi:hypothetical protein AOLI_G00212080 [Acnodon oligacanthus]